MSVKTYDIEVNTAALVKVAPVIKDVVVNAGLDTFTDPRYYPSRDVDKELTLRYFIFMVAIDHRTSRYVPFEGYVNNEFYHGADLLYRLGMSKFNEDPGFFNPSNMANLTPDEVKAWLSADDGKGGRVTIWDPEVRADLLRDLGRKLKVLYGGSVSSLIESSGNHLKRGNGQGLVDKLKVFKAYSDPVEKKAYLFIKFIERRGLIQIEDPWNKEVPVDNHLTRIALRLGLVRVYGLLKKKLEHNEPFEWGEDVALRLTVRKAYKELHKIAGLDVFHLDDFLWMFGRKTCLRVNPKCKVLGRDACPLSNVCENIDVAERISEHNFLNTYYY